MLWLTSLWKTCFHPLRDTKNFNKNHQIEVNRFISPKFNTVYYLIFLLSLLTNNNSSIWFLHNYAWGCQCLPVRIVPLKPAGKLKNLCTLVGSVASKEQVVSGLHHPRKPHEQHTVNTHNPSHFGGNHVWRLVHVNHRGANEAPVCYWSPEVGC